MVHFKTRIASDIVRDGLGLELLDPSGLVVAEVFRCDREHTITVATFGKEIPLHAMQQLLDQALRELGPFEDGTPLPGFP